MMTVETIGRIRRAHLVEGESIRGIARRLRLSRQVVRRAIASKTGEFHYERSVQPLPKLGSHVADLKRLLEENERRQRRERLTLIRIWEELLAPRSPHLGRSLLSAGPRQGEERDMLFDRVNVKRPIDSLSRDAPPRRPPGKLA